jgi:hypothetical protein
VFHLAQEIIEIVRREQRLRADDRNRDSRAARSLPIVPVERTRIGTFANCSPRAQAPQEGEIVARARPADRR